MRCSLHIDFCGRQWETASLILCLRWVACANACGTNRGWLFLCRANLPRFDARIGPHFHTSSLSSTHKIDMLAALFNL